MHILYLDHSGDVADTSQRHFVLAGISVFERQGYWISQKLDEIAARFSPHDPHSVELHASRMRGGGGLWRRFPVKDRLRAMSDVLAIVRDARGQVNLFAAIVEKVAISPDDPVRYTFEETCKRFDKYLMRLHKQGNTQRGVVVFDEATYETTIQNLARDFRSVGHKWGVVRNLAEVPLFLDSKASRMIQLADLVAFSLFRHYEKNDSTFFDIIENCFDNVGGISHGLHYFSNVRGFKLESG
jgi:Protein of unknown function (DUF3800)